MIKTSEAAALVDSATAWKRMATAALISTIGSVGQWSIVVVLPVVQAHFGASRAEVAFVYTAMMLGFAFGNAVMGRLADRSGLLTVLLAGIALIASGYLVSSAAPNLWVFAFGHFLIGLGNSTVFAPLIADISHWFYKRRGIAVALAASGNYLAGAIWPPILQALIVTQGFRAVHVAVAVILLVVMPPLAYLMRHQMPLDHSPVATGSSQRADLGLSPRTLMILLCVAGFACCVAMSMPQAHIVAYCGDLGYGAARGAEMLSLMLGFGIISRVGSGFIADKIGGVATLMVGSVLQAVALALYLSFDGLSSLYVISALFGLFQGGIVPSYAIIVREYFSPREAATRVGVVIMMTVFGMAFGGWVSGYLFDLTGSYKAAFAHSIGWNALNLVIAFYLLTRGQPRRPAGLQAA